MCYVLLSDLCSADKSPLKYFIEEMANGNSLRSTTTIGNEKIQERVYDTIFCMPWRCDFVAVTGEKILDTVFRFRWGRRCWISFSFYFLFLMIFLKLKFTLLIFCFNF
jgi:hypothetical protein